MIVLRCVPYLVGDSAVHRTWCWCVWPVWHGFRTVEGQSFGETFPVTRSLEGQESKVAHTSWSFTWFCFDGFPLQDQKGYESLRFAWLSLGTRERSSLTDHFLADGIEDLDACSLVELPRARDFSVLMSIVAQTVMQFVLVFRHLC